MEVWLVGWLSVGGGRFLIMRQIDGTDMMVLVGPLGLISIGGMRYQLAACYTFHIHACMAAASLGWVLELIRIGLDARQEGYQ